MWCGLYFCVCVFGFCGCEQRSRAEQMLPRSGRCAAAALPLRTLNETQIACEPVSLFSSFTLLIVKQTLRSPFASGHDLPTTIIVIS